MSGLAADVWIDMDPRAGGTTAAMSHEDADPLGWCDSCHGLVVAWTSWEPFVSARGDLLLFCDGCLRRAQAERAERDRIAAREEPRD